MQCKTRVAAVALMVVMSACSSGESVETTSPAITDDITTSETTPTTTAPTTTTAVAPTTTEPAETTATTAPPAEPEVMAINIVFENGSVVGDTRITVPLGEEVVVTVEADVTDHVHLHGYDIFADVEPGAPATIEFTADIPGVFEMELEDSRQRLVELEVTP